MVRDRVAKLEEENKRLFNCLKIIVSRLNKLEKKEETETETETERIKKWITDDRLESAQQFLHKGSSK